VAQSAVDHLRQDFRRLRKQRLLVARDNSQIGKSPEAIARIYDLLPPDGARD